MAPAHRTRTRYRRPRATGPERKRADLRQNPAECPRHRPDPRARLCRRTFASASAAGAANFTTQPPKTTHYEQNSQLRTAATPDRSAQFVHPETQHHRGQLRARLHRNGPRRSTAHHRRTGCVRPARRSEDPAAPTLYGSGNTRSESRVGSLQIGTERDASYGTPARIYAVARYHLLEGRNGMGHDPPRQRTGAKPKRRSRGESQQGQFATDLYRRGRGLGKILQKRSPGPSRRS